MIASCCARWVGYISKWSTYLWVIHFCIEGKLRLVSCWFWFPSLRDRLPQMFFILHRNFYSLRFVFVVIRCYSSPRGWHQLSSSPKFTTVLTEAPSSTFNVNMKVAAQRPKIKSPGRKFSCQEKKKTAWKSSLEVRRTCQAELDTRKTKKK